MYLEYHLVDEIPYRAPIHPYFYISTQIQYHLFPVVLILFPGIALLQQIYQYYCCNSSNCYHPQNNPHRFFYVGIAVLSVISCRLLL